MDPAASLPRTPSPVVLAALAELRRETGRAASELLDHVPDAGDLRTQRALDAWVEQAADALLAVSEAAEEQLLDVARPPLHPEGGP